MKATEHLKSVFAESFKFAIGDIVYKRTDCEALKAEAKLNGPRGKYERVGGPLGSVVVQRLIEECHGGVQLHYTVHSRHKDGGTVAARAFEFELVPIDEACDALSLSVSDPKKED